MEEKKQLQTLALADTGAASWSLGHEPSSSLAIIDCMNHGVCIGIMLVKDFTSG